MMTANKANLIALSILIATIAADDIHAQHEYDLPLGLPSAVDQVKELILRRYTTSYRHSKEEYIAEHNAFNEYLDQLALQLEGEVSPSIAALEGERIDAKLAVIAVDRLNNPQIYDVILQTYTKARELPPGQPSPRVLQPPKPTSEHLGEEYRLAWEYLLIAPQFPGFHVLTTERTLEALAKINDVRSLRTLLYFYEATCKEGTEINYSSILNNIQSDIIYIISHYANHSALKTIMRCIEMSNDQLERVRDTEYEKAISWNPEKRFLEMTRYVKPQQWRQVIQDYPMNGLTTEQTSMLTRIKNAIEARSEKE